MKKCSKDENAASRNNKWQKLHYSNMVDNYGPDFTGKLKYLDTKILNKVIDVIADKFKGTELSLKKPNFDFRFLKSEWGI